MKKVDINQLFAVNLGIVYLVFTWIFFNKVDGDSNSRNFLVLFFILTTAISYFCYTKSRKIFWFLFLLQAVIFIIVMSLVYHYHCCFTFEVGEL